MKDDYAMMIHEDQVKKDKIKVGPSFKIIKHNVLVYIYIAYTC